jgi:hypothetical protein
LLLRDARDFGEAPQGKFDFPRKGFRGRAKTLEKRAHDAIVLRDKGGEEMQRLDHLMIVAGGNLVRFLECFLGFDGQLVKTEHGRLDCRLDVASLFMVRH